MVLLDGGAEVGMYAGDVTRTFSVSGSPEARQREIHDVVRDAHAAAIQTCQPGAPVSAVHEAARRALGLGLEALGVVQGDSSDEEGQALLDRLFPHRTSHWLGLAVHDVGDYHGPQGPRLLEAGMVLTVEPGLYFPSGIEGAGQRFEGIGVRIEDDILITEDGAENLTAALPVDPVR